MESVSSRSLAEEAVKLFRLCFWAGRSIDSNNPMRPRASSLYFHVLFMLQNQHGPNITMSQLAEATIASKQQLSKLIGAMEEKGLVQREHDPVNRRQVYVRILPAGIAMIDEMIEDVRTHAVQVLEIFDDEERRELYDSFMLFRRLLQKITAAHYNSPIQSFGNKSSPNPNKNQDF